MATTNNTTRQQAGVYLRQLVQRYRGAIAAVVEGVALLLRLPLAVHVLVTVITELAISLALGRDRRRR